MTEPGRELVPFGKYKGQPVELLLADRSYVEWLLSQVWLRDKFPTFHQTIINYGGEPVETPEHNELQASFLTDERCLALARLLYAPTRLDETQAAMTAKRSQPRPVWERFAAHLECETGGPTVRGRTFEADGWDVVYRVDPCWLFFKLTSLPPCLCRSCSHDADCAEDAPCRGGSAERKWGCRHRSCLRRFVPTWDWWEHASQAEIERVASELGRDWSGGHCNEECPWSDRDAALWLLDDERRLFEPSTRGTIRVECKPDLGDDFPAVLRQAKRYECGYEDRLCVLVRRYAFESVNWEQVFQIFATSRIVLVGEDRLTAEEEALTTDAGEAGREEESDERLA